MTEGESAFGEMSGSAPKSVHQQALRGIAKVLLEVSKTPFELSNYIQFPSLFREHCNVRIAKALLEVSKTPFIPSFTVHRTL